MIEPHHNLNFGNSNQIGNHTIDYKNQQNQYPKSYYYYNNIVTNNNITNTKN